MAAIQQVPLEGGARVPTLADALALARGRVPVNVEIKDARAVGPVGEVLRDLRVLDAVLLSSFDEGAVAMASAALPQVPRALVMGDTPPGPRSLATSLYEALPGRGLSRVGARAWHPSARLVRRGLVEALHRQGVEVNVWTVNDPTDLRRLAALGVDGVFTDRPGALRSSA